MKKYNYIDFFKTMGMFLVILAHCSLFYSGNQFWPVRAEQDVTLFRWISNFLLVSAVPIFVFASGFLLQISLQKNKSSMVGLVRKKAVRLLIPYFIYGILWLVPTYTFFDIPSFGRDKATSLMDGYKAMALGEFSDVSWFLLMLFWVTLIWILLKGLLRKSNIIYGAMVSVILYLAAHFFLGQIDYYKISQIDVYFIVFFVGAAFFYISDFVYNNVSKGILLIGSLVGIVACVCLAQLSTEMYMMECILKIVSPVLLLTFSMGLCRTKVVGNLEKTAVYNWLRKNSLYIYLLQAPGMYIIFAIIYPVIGSNIGLCFLLQFILTTLLDVILTLAYVFIKEKIMGFVHQI